MGETYSILTQMPSILFYKLLAITARLPPWVNFTAFVHKCLLFYSINIVSTIFTLPAHSCTLFLKKKTNLPYASAVYYKSTEISSKHIRNGPVSS